MKATYQVRIETPCSEDWSKMTPVEKGRYCAACQKTVVDMTLMSDREIQDFFMRSEGEVCAQMHTDQQNRNLITHEATKSKGWRYLWGLLVAGLFSSQEVKAQGKATIKPAVQQNIPAKGVQVETNFFWEFTVKDSKTLEAIPRASIQITSTGKYLSADENGMVRIELQTKDSIVLKISAIGYPEMEYSISPSNNSQVLYLERKAQDLAPVIVLANDLNRLNCRVGGLTVCYSTYRYNFIKKPTIDSLTQFFVKKPLKVYPNPVAPGSSFQLEVNIAQLGEAVIEIIDNQGRIVQRKQIVVENKNSILSVPTNSVWGKGVYWIRITHHATKKNYTTKLVLQS